MFDVSEVSANEPAAPSSKPPPAATAKASRLFPPSVGASLSASKLIVPLAALTTPSICAVVEPAMVALAQVPAME